MSLILFNSQLFDEKMFLNNTILAILIMNMKINSGEKHQGVEISDKEIIIYKDKSALIGSIIVLVLVFLTGVIALKNINFPNNLEHDGIIFFAFSCILISSFFLVIAIYRFFSPREAVIINN